MAVLLNLIQRELTEPKIQELSRNLGADSVRVSVAISATVPMLINAIARFSENSSETATGFGENPKRLAQLLHSFNSRTGDISAVGALDKLCGDRLPSLMSGISASSGLPRQTVSDLLAILLPVVLGAIGQIEVEKNLNEATLAQMIVQESQQARQQSPQVTGILNQFHGPAPKTQLPKDPYLNTPSKKNSIFDI